MIYINNLKLQIIKQINSGQKKLTFFGYIQFTYYYYYVQILQISSKFIQQQKAQSLFDILQKAMTQVTNTFANIKRQLLTFQHSEQQMRQRLNHINQTRSKINNQLVNLTKDYERKIKQLQYRLEEVVNKNQQLQKQNKLCRKQIQSIEERLLQKQKLIAMLISQQTERFSSQTYLGKNRSQNFNKGKDSKKNYQIILPKSINTVQTINFPNQPNEKNQKQEQYANKQGYKQGYVQHQTQKNDNKNKKFDKTHKGGNYGQHIHPLISIEQQLSKNQQYGDQINNKQDNMKDLNQANQQQRFQNEQINTSKTKATVPPPPQKRKTKPTEVPKNIKKTTPTYQQQNNSIKNEDHIQNIEGKSLQQNKDLSSKFNDGIQKTDNLHSQQKNQIQQIKDKNIQSSQNKSRIPPPPLKNKSTQKKNAPIPTFQQKFLQDSPPKAQQQHEQRQNKQQAHQNVQNNNQNLQQFQVLQQQNQDKDKQQKYNTALNEAFGFEHINQQNKQKQSRIQIQQNMPEQAQQNVNQQIEQSYRRVPPPPPPKKASKNKAKATPKIPRNIKTFQQHQQQQTSNIQQTNQSQQQYHQQQQYQQHSSNPNLNNNPNNKFQQIPHSSQDFFANLATQQNNQQDYGYQNKMIQAQQSSIDYADTHSIVSSSAAYMLDSQYIPQQSSAFKQTTTPEIKKMQKKKQGKRQVKSIDPQSFV